MSESQVSFYLSTTFEWTLNDPNIAYLSFLGAMVDEYIPKEYLSLPSGVFILFLKLASAQDH